MAGLCKRFSAELRVGIFQASEFINVQLEFTFKDIPDKLIYPSVGIYIEIGLVRVQFHRRHFLEGRDNYISSRFYQITSG